ncbi:hypothetical protein HHI36_004347 [Cryptolaemus montrouzieri]|uniref:Uncharacterized protein n=1 Tax=Cryptolaemus montrouzieri TaxID=559131 RepID=A0ABD2NR60_9CUCU
MINPCPSRKLDHPNSKSGSLAPEDQIADEQPSGIQILGDRFDNSRSSSVSSSQNKMNKVVELYDEFEPSKIIDLIDVSNLWEFISPHVRCKGCSEEIKLFVEKKLGATSKLILRFSNAKKIDNTNRENKALKFYDLSFRIVYAFQNIGLDATSA